MEFPTEINTMFYFPLEYIKKQSEIKRLENKSISEILKTAEKLMDDKEYDEAEIYVHYALFVLINQVKRSQRQLLLCHAFNYLGLIYYKKVEFNKAQIYYARSIQMDESFAPAYYNRGVIHFRLGEFMSAVNNLEIAVHLQPENKDFQDALQASRDRVNQI